MTSTSGRFRFLRLRISGDEVRLVGVGRRVRHRLFARLVRVLGGGVEAQGHGPRGQGPGSSHRRRRQQVRPPVRRRHSSGEHRSHRGVRLGERLRRVLGQGSGQHQQDLQGVAAAGQVQVSILFTFILHP